MFNFFKQSSQPKGETLNLAINGMHCASCAMTIDGSLEDTPGVIKAKTSYARGEVMVEYDPTQLQPAKLKKVVSDLGYQVVEK